MPHRGYIKLWRKAVDNRWYLEGEFDRFHAFLDLLIRARHKPGVVVLDGRPIPLEVGQLIYSYASLATRWTWSIKRVRTFLGHLEREGTVTLDRAGGRKWSRLTVVNYADHQRAHSPSDLIVTYDDDGQAEGTHGARTGHARGTQRTTNKNVEECLKNGEEPPSRPREATPTNGTAAAEVWEQYKGRPLRLDEMQTIRGCLSRFGDAATLDAVRAAIEEGASYGSRIEFHAEKAARPDAPTQSHADRELEAWLATQKKGDA